MPGFDLTVQHPSDGVVSLTLRGTLDAAYAYRFDDTLRHVERDATRCLILDLRELEFVDSTALSRLVAASHRARRASRRLILVRGPTVVQRVFGIAALDDLFEIVDDPDEVAPAQP